MEGTDDLRSLASSNRTLANPVRLAIMLLLVSRGPMVFSWIQRILNLTPGNLDSHIRRLREEGYVETKKEFVECSPRTVIMPTPKGVEETLRYVSRLRRILERLAGEAVSHAGGAEGEA